VLALFPALLRALPKSGSWLNAVKVVMGFLEVAAALKFFRTAELRLLDRPEFFTFDLVLGTWIALCLLCALYLLGTYRLPHDTPSENISVPRLIFSMAFLALGFYLLPALFKINNSGDSQRPTGNIYAWVDAFLLPDTVGSAESGHITGDLPFAIRQAREQRQRTGEAKRIFVDFTGKTCTNCKINERNVFPKPEVRELLNRYQTVQLFTDTVPEDMYVPRARTADRNDQDAVVNLDFQLKVFKTEQLPLYAILEPRVDGKTQIVAVYTEGRINNEAAFIQFLKSP
jgi:thiol:disulfide interchange protein